MCEDAHGLFGPGKWPTEVPSLLSFLHTEAETYIGKYTNNCQTGMSKSCIYFSFSFFFLEGGKGGWGEGGQGEGELAYH